MGPESQLSLRCIETVLPDVLVNSGNAFCVVSPVTRGKSIQVVFDLSSETSRDPGNVGAWGNVVRRVGRGKGIDEDRPWSGAEQKDPDMLGMSIQIEFCFSLDFKVERRELEGPDDLLLGSPSFCLPWACEKAKAIEGENSGPASKDDRVHVEARARSWQMVGD